VIETMPSPIRVGIIGLSARGGWAARAHVPALAALSGYELTALSASSAASARAAGDRFGVKQAYADPVALATSDDVDLVVVTVRVLQHRQLIVPAIEAGKMVLAEWPLASGLAEAEDLVALAARRGAVTAVGLQARSAPVLRYLRDLIDSGFVGTVLSTSMIASGSSWGATTSNPGQAYLVDRCSGATMVTIPFGHTIDALTMVLGDFAEVDARTAIRRSVSVDAETGAHYPRTAADQLVVSGALQSGAVASIHYRGGMCAGTNFHWEINGTDGDIVLTGPNGHLQFGQVHMAGARSGDSSLHPLITPASYDRVPALADTDPAYTVAHAYEAFRADRLRGTHEVPDFAHAAGTHRLIAAIETAAATGQRQSLPPASQRQETSA
jgi:predicted dehydrogenase